MAIKATTRDQGLAIRDFLDEQEFSILIDQGGELEESHKREVIFIDCADPNNLSVFLDNGQKFVVRIIAGE